MKPALIAILLVAPACGAQPEVRFAAAGNCRLCHSSIPLPAAARDIRHALTGEGSPDAGARSSIAPFTLWSGSMMAYSARDPYWRAKVRFEAAVTPAAREAIEDTCLRCHAPMQQYAIRMAGGRMAFDQLTSFGEGGVSCTVCHQIGPGGLGSRRSFEGGFRIHSNREIYGPHADPFPMPMLMHTGYRPVESGHLLDAALCGTCHTVITPVLDSSGRAEGEFLEQAPYLEWLLGDASAHGITCQSCHMPVLADARGRDVAQFIAHRPHGGPFPPTSPRAPFGQHFLSGGNVPMLGLLSELFPAEAEPLERGFRRTSDSLRGALALDAAARIDAGMLLITVDVFNKTGHKLPTGFPSRRVWLRLLVTDSSGKPVFESGGWDERAGDIAGIRGFEPHRSTINRPNQAAIYEAELEDRDGVPTVSLLSAARYRKDNRILPAGFDLKKRLPPGIQAGWLAPAGTGTDTDFRPGSDRVEYRVKAGGRGPYRVQVEACYQSVKPGHAAKMQASRSAEEARFVALFARHNRPVIMASKELTIGGAERAGAESRAPSGAGR